MIKERGNFRIMKITHEQILNKSIAPFKAFSFRSRDSSRIIPPHWHESTEILFVLSGKMNTTINGRLQEIKQNQFIIINPCVIHSTNALKNSHILCIQYPFTFLNLVTNGKFQQFFHFNSKLNSISSSTLSANTINLVKFLETQDKDISINLSIYILGLQILQELIEKYLVVTHCSTSKNIPFLNEFIDFVSKHYTENISLHMVADHFDYSVAYCSRLIRKNLDHSFSDYLTSLRLEQSLRLSLQSNLNIEKIAEKSGFKCYRNLYNAFKKVYNCTPEEAFNQLKE